MAKICRRTGKRNYRSKKEAERALAEVQAESTMRKRYDKIQVAVYHCLFCPYWHLTSQKQKSSQQE